MARLQRRVDLIVSFRIANDGFDGTLVEWDYSAGGTLELSTVVVVHLVLRYVASLLYRFICSSVLQSVVELDVSRVHCLVAVWVNGSTGCCVVVACVCRMQRIVCELWASSSFFGLGLFLVDPPSSKSPGALIDSFWGEWNPRVELRAMWSTSMRWVSSECHDCTTCNTV